MDTKAFYEERAAEHNAELTAIAKGKRRLITHDDRFELVVAYLRKEWLGKKDLQVLDVGCGDGVYEKLLDNDILQKNTFFGLDISDLQREKSRSVFKEVKGIDFEKDDIPYEEGRFDYVICSEVVEHLFYPEKILNEIKRVLKPGGILVFTTPNLASLQIRLAMMFWGTSPCLDYRENKQHIRFYTKKTILGMMKGLQFVQQIGINSLVFERFMFPVRIILPYFLQRVSNKLFPNLSAGLFLIFKK